MEEVGWSQAGVWRSERDHFINDDIMFGVTDTMYTLKEFLLNSFEVQIMHVHNRMFHSKDGRDLHFVASWS